MLTITRSGNLLSFPAENTLKLLQQALTYDHKTQYHGYELRQRINTRRSDPTSTLNPHMDIEPRRLYDVVKGNVLCAAGLYQRIATVLRQFNVPHDYIDLRKNVLPIAEYSRLERLMPFEFRHRQNEVIAMIDSCSGGVISAPTGYGKTFIMTLLSVIYPHSRLAFISPGVALMTSTYNRLNEVVPGEIGRIGNGKDESDRRILLCSADSIHKLPMGKCQLIVYDEVHTAATDRRTKLLCSQHTDAKFIGFTASPNCRADGADAVVEALFGPILMEVTYAEGVENSIVSNINVLFVPVVRNETTPSLFGETWVKKRDGFWRNAHRNLVIADAVKNLPPNIPADPQILVMVETVEHAFELRRHLPDFEVMYSTMKDEEGDSLRNRLIGRGLLSETEPEMTSERKEWLLTEFEQGRLKRVISTQCWKQGIDPVHLNVFVRADGGSSEINNIQLPGRLSRVTKDKTEGLLIDFWDEWDGWTLGRSRSRKSAYKKNGYTFLPMA